MKLMATKTENHSHWSIVGRIANLLREHTLIFPGEKVVVAVSGGADSLALLHILRAVDLQLQLLAVYIDHGLRPLETPQEQKTIKEYCRTLEVPYFSQAVDVHHLVASEKRSPEEAARILRYAALECIRIEQGAKLIAVGHTADDQVEEFFLRLIRGSSTNGLSGMLLRSGRIIRPLLHESKAALVLYLQSLAVDWCQDSSNLRRQFLRNRVRLDLLPTLERDFNPAIRRTVLQTMDMLGEEDHFLDEQTTAALAKCLVSHTNSHLGQQIPQLEIDTTIFFEYHVAICRRLLEKCYWQMKIRPTFRMIQILLDFLKDGENGSEIHLGDGVRAEKRASHLILWRPLEKGRIRGSKTAGTKIHIIIPGPGCYLVPEAGRELILEEIPLAAYRSNEKKLLFVEYDKIAFPLLLRNALPGELFHPCNGIGRKKISRFFNDRKIPANDRLSWPVLVSGSEIIALPGLQIDHAMRITEETSAILAIDWRQSQD